MAGSSTSPESPAPHQRAARLAFAFVVLSLTALVVVPLLVQRRIDALRDQLELEVEPSRALVTEVQYYLAREMSALRGYMIAEDPSFLDRYAEMVREEQIVYRELRPLAEGLGPEVLRLLARLEALSEQWHDRAARDQAAVRRDLQPDPRVEAALYEEVLATAAALDQAIASASRDLQAGIRSTERTSLFLTAGLVLLALGAALVVLWFGYRVRLLADTASRALHETRSVVEERARLLRGITHDVKNPLGAADGYAQLLEAGIEPLTDRQAQWVAGLRRSLRGALSLIEGLLSFERADSAQVGIERRPVELSALVRQIAAEHAGVIPSAGHSIEVDVRGPVSAWTDPERVRQILGNLISNAVKYTPPPGRVTLSIEVLARDPKSPGQGRWAVLHVRDTGPGIAQDQHDRIFQEFHRLEGAGPDGHGLGLAISRRLAELLEGRLTVDSAPARGSVFSLWLPMRAEDEPAPD